MRFIRVRPVRTNSCPTEDELVDAEWHSLVDMEMSRSPRSAHLQMREDRRQEQLQRAREKDRLKEMQAKLERYQRNEPEYETTSMGTGARQPRQTVPFSQKRQQEILEEFQRQNDLQMEKEEQAEKIRLQQQRQKLKEERRQQRRESRVAPEAGKAVPMSSGQVHGSLLGSLPRRIWRNEGCDAFKLAFQDLMDRQREYLRE